MPALLVSDIFPPKTGGSGRWFWEIYSRLSRTDYLIAAGEDPRQQAFDHSHDLRVLRLPLSLRRWGIANWQGLRGYWGAISRLRKLIDSQHVNMIHSARVLPEGVMALALKWHLGIPYICYVHGEDVTTARDSREYVFLVRRVLQGARLLIANSHNTRRILCDEWNVPTDRVTVLHPGVDTSRFVPAPRNAVVRRQLGWNDRPVILTVGRLQKRKGHDQMIRAVRLLKATFPDILYVAIGDGEERCALEQLMQDEHVTSNVQLVGEIDDRRLIECYQQCDLFILPNRQVGQDIEGFGMVLLEAQACGKPAIAGKSGGTSEAINAPATGRIISCETPVAIATCLAQLLREPTQLSNMGRVGRNWVVAHFDWRSLAAQAGALFDSCCPSVV